MYKRILAIGDIHGEYDKLLSLYRKIDFSPPDDLLVFLGDYVDRGPQPLKVLDWLMERAKDPHIVMLRGNHEQMMLDHEVSKASQRALGWRVPAEDSGDEWLDNGGWMTILRLQELRSASTPRDFAAYRDRLFPFLAELPLSFRIEAGGRDFFFCHAGVRPGVPLEDQDAEDLLWIRAGFHLGYAGEAVIVAGHTPARNIPRRSVASSDRDEDVPIMEDNMILVDTGACRGGRLSCVDVLSGRVWQDGED